MRPGGAELTTDTDLTEEEQSNLKAVCENLQVHYKGKIIDADNFRESAEKLGYNEIIKRGKLVGINLKFALLPVISINAWHKKLTSEKVIVLLNAIDCGIIVPIIFYIYFFQKKLFLYRKLLYILALNQEISKIKDPYNFLRSNSFLSALIIIEVNMAEDFVKNVRLRVQTFIKLINKNPRPTKKVLLGEFEEYLKLLTLELENVPIEIKLLFHELYKGLIEKGYHEKAAVNCISSKSFFHILQPIVLREVVIEDTFTRSILLKAVQNIADNLAREPDETAAALSQGSTADPIRDYLCENVSEETLEMLYQIFKKIAQQERIERTLTSPVIDKQEIQEAVSWFDDVLGGATTAFNEEVKPTSQKTRLGKKTEKLPSANDVTTTINPLFRRYSQPSKQSIQSEKRRSLSSPISPFLGPKK